MKHMLTADGRPIVFQHERVLTDGPSWTVVGARLADCRGGVRLPYGHVLAAMRPHGLEHGGIVAALAVQFDDTGRPWLLWFSPKSSSQDVDDISGTAVSLTLTLVADAREANAS